MISEASTIRHFRRKIPILIILVIGAVLRLYKIGEAFPFDFDQQIPAQAAYEFFVNHKITLIGQELSFKGFFLGPLHNWIQFIPYRFCNLLPDCTPYFYVSLGLVTIAVLYFVSKKIFDSKIAVIASGIYGLSFAAISFERGVNSNYFLFLSSIAVFYSLYRYFQGKNIHLIFGAFLAGLATVNFNPIFIFSAIVFFVVSFLRENRKFVIYLTASFAFFVNYLPLIIFNFRHDNILWNNFLRFLKTSTATEDYPQRLIFLVKDVAVPFYSNYLFQSADVWFLIFTVSFVALGFYKLWKAENKFLYFLPLWIIAPVFGLTFYQGHIPDYYFQQSLLPFILVIAAILRKNFAVFLIFTSIFLMANTQKAVNYTSSINYKIKKQIVEYVIRDSSGESFNVFIEMPPGLNTGYDYLFRILGRQPAEGAKNLYFLEFSDPSKFRKYKFYNVFPNKNIEVRVVGFVHIVSVK